MMNQSDGNLRAVELHLYELRAQAAEIAWPAGSAAHGHAAGANALARR